MVRKYNAFKNLQKKIVGVEAGFAKLSDRYDTIAHMLKTHREKAKEEREAMSNSLASLLETAEAVRMDLQQGEAFLNHKSAFERAEVLCKEIFRDRKKDKGTLQLQVIAVASSFSWNFLTRNILQALKESGSSLRVEVELLLVDPTLLKSIEAGENAEGRTWYSLSENRPDDAIKLFKALSTKVENQYSLKIRHYANVPHWHGLLVDNSSLFMGRTSWEATEGGKRSLRVGENTYRQFTTGSYGGEERIALFKNWHEYYSENSKLVFSSDQDG